MPIPRATSSACCLLEAELSVEGRPTDVATQTLVVQHQFPDLIGKLIALPLALEPTGDAGLTWWSNSAYGLDRIGGRTKIVCGNVGHGAGLSGGIRREPCCSPLVTRRAHGVTAGGAGLHHRDLATNPGADVVDRLPWSRITRMSGLEQLQHMLRAGRRPERQQPVVGVRQGAATTDRDEPGIPHVREDHDNDDASSAARAPMPTSPTAMSNDCNPVPARCSVRAGPHCPDRTPPIRWISCTIPAPGRRW